MSESKGTPQTKPSWLSSFLRSRWTQGILIAALVLVAVFIALTLSVVPLLNQWLPPVLDRLVAPGSQVTIRSLTRQQLIVDAIDLQPSDGLLIQLKNAELAYHDIGLLQGQADLLHVETLKIVLTDPTNSTDEKNQKASPSRSEKSNEPITVSLPGIHDLMTLPVTNISIDTLEIDTPDISARLQANVTPEHWLFTGTATLPHIPAPLDVYFQIQRNESERSDILMMLSQQDALLAQLWAVIHQKSDQSGDKNEGQTTAQLRIESDLSALQASLPELAALPLRTRKMTIEGLISSPTNAEWPNDLNADLTGALLVNRSTPGEGVTLKATGANITIKHDGSGERWKIQTQLQKTDVELQLPEEGNWLASMPAQAFTADCDSLITECAFETKLNAKLQGKTQAEITVSPKGQWTKNGASNLTLPIAISYQQDALDGLPAWDMNTKGSLVAQLDEQGDWQVTSTEGLTTTANMQTYEGWSVSLIKAVLVKELNISGNINDLSDIKSAPLNLSIAPLKVTSEEAKLSFAPSRLSCHPGDINLNDMTSAILANCDISLRLNDSKWDQWPVPDVSLFGPISITMDEVREHMTAGLEIKAANSQIHFRTRAEHDLKTNTGSLQWQLLDAQTSWLALGLSEMENLVSTQLLHGQLSGQGWVDWTQVNDDQGERWEVTPDIMLRADGVGAVYDNSLTLEDGNAMFALRRRPDGNYLLDAQISANKVDSGIPLKNILARSQTSIPADFSYVDITIHEMHLDLLGGRVYAPEVKYDSRKEINAFGIRLDHIQLSQVAAIEEGAGIKATGLLDGMLPIVLTKDGPMIPGGNMFARDPGGVIKYQDESADALAQSDQSVGMAMKLLQNFQYDQLQSGVQYQPDGKLNLALQFQGKNPDFFDGQATHLNVNLEYNLLDLLESLRIANDVIEKVEAKYK